jgi:hypothetical protein
VSDEITNTGDFAKTRGAAGTEGDGKNGWHDFGYNFFQLEHRVRYGPAGSSLCISSESGVGAEKLFPAHEQ